jgi:hypothetical protein
MAVFVFSLTWLTTLCGWPGLQAINSNGAFAVDAHTIVARRSAQKCPVYISDFLDMPINARQLQIDQQVRYRCLPAVVDPPGKIDIGLIARLEQLKPYLLPQLVETVV